MITKTHTLFLVNESPLHAGSGSDLGIVDLPIQRERHTSFPKIEGSSLKGAIRQACEWKVNSKKFDDYGDDDVKIHRVFGFDDGGLSHSQKEDLEKCFTDEEHGKTTDFAGCIAFSDARLLLFPVKSMQGVFAWVTCPKVLHQLVRDMNLRTDQETIKIDGLANITKTFNDNKETDKSIAILTNSQSTLTINNKHIILEEYAFESQTHPLKVGETDLGAWLAQLLFSNDGYSCWKEKVSRDLVILSDSDFRDFVNLSTEVITRTKISNETGTVEQGALFTEEYLPAESVLYSLIMANNEFRKGDNKMEAHEVVDFFKDVLPPVLQIGGNTTLGKGLTRTIFE